jgi:exodeoxyribonuclease VII large subunit
MASGPVLRRATPTHAAQLVAPVRDELVARVAGLRARADRALASIVDARRRELRALRAELLEPAHALSRARHRVDDLLHRASAGVRASARRERERLDRLRARLSRQEPRRHLRELIARMEGATRRLGAWQAAYFRREGMRLERLQARLEPANVAKLLARGFALVLKDGRLVSKSGQVGADDAVRIALAQGWIDARVTSRDAGEDPLPGRGRPAGGDTSSGGSVDPHFRRR